MEVGRQSGLVKTVRISSLLPLNTFTKEACPSPHTFARPGETKTQAKANLGERAGLREDWGREGDIVTAHLQLTAVVAAKYFLLTTCNCQTINTRSWSSCYKQTSSIQWVVTSS